MWQLAEDPAFPTSPPAFPELPPDLPPELVPSTTTPTLIGVDQRDYEGVAGYGERAAGETGSGAVRSTSSSYFCF